MTKKKSKSSMSYEQLREHENKKKVKLFSIVLLIVMLGSVIGFSIIGTPNIGNNSPGSNGNVGYSENIFQDPTTGQTFDGAIIEGTQFIFREDIEEYKSDEELITKSDELLNQNSSIDVFVDENFQNDNARFLISQGLSVNGISTNLVQQPLCSDSQTTLIYTTNSSSIDENISNCIVFESSSINATSLSYGLVYHLIKDIN